MKKIEVRQKSTGIELIDTCWDVNLDSVSLINLLHFGINRYMLECKSYAQACLQALWQRINRYMLECKLSTRISRGVSIFELIDTCWNVNNLGDRTEKVTGAELIDTCWNVNIFIFSFCHISTRINRYMLECKFVLFGIYASFMLELIDTCWNVNYLLQLLACMTRSKN